MFSVSFSFVKASSPASTNSTILIFTSLFSYPAAFLNSRSATRNILIICSPPSLLPPMLLCIHKRACLSIFSQLASSVATIPVQHYLPRPLRIPGTHASYRSYRWNSSHKRILLETTFHVTVTRITQLDDNVLEHFHSSSRSRILLLLFALYISGVMLIFQTMSLKPFCLVWLLIGLKKLTASLILIGKINPR